MLTSLLSATNQLPQNVNIKNVKLISDCSLMFIERITKMLTSNVQMSFDMKNQFV